MKAVNKAIQRDEFRRSKNNIDVGMDKRYIHVKANGKLYQIEFKEIIFVEAVGDYVKIITPSKKILTHDTMKNFEDTLPESQFLRVHRSYIISLDKIEFIEGNRVKVGEEFIPVGNSYREALISYINSRRMNDIK